MYSYKPISISVVECVNCKARSEIEYANIGIPLSCKSCLAYNIPKVVVSNNSFSFLTAKNFYDLCAQNDCRYDLNKLLNEWFGYKIINGEFDYSVINSNGECIDKLWLHYKIQTNSLYQSAIYQYAMSVWR